MAGRGAGIIIVALDDDDGAWQDRVTVLGQVRRRAAASTVRLCGSRH